MLTLVLLALYLAALLVLSRRRRGETGTLDYLLAGRRLTLPAFVATLVTTWYGGILGVGEYAWTYGLSSWIVFGIPYYIAAVVFAVFLANRLRSTNAVSIPELLEQTYGRSAGTVGAGAVLLLTVPAAYLMMLGTLIASVSGLSSTWAMVVGVSLSGVYVGLSGFRAVVRTDLLQLALMYGGFLILLPAALHHTGGLGGLWAQLPSDHRSWDGGLGWQTVLVWYLIAFQTMVEPAFYQRVFAAKSPRTARRGVLAAVLLWAVFDFLTTFSGLAARVLIPELGDPVAAYPELARLVLPLVPHALFTLGLFATVMSTLDSYLFLAATTIGYDILRLRGPRERLGVRVGLAIAGLAALAGALVFDSVVRLWHDIGTVVTSALLLPVLSVHFAPRWRPARPFVPLTIIAGAGTAVAWILLAHEGRYPLGVEPMFPALAAATAVWAVGVSTGRSSRSGRMPEENVGGSDAACS